MVMAQYVARLCPVESSQPELKEVELVLGEELCLGRGRQTGIKDKYISRNQVKVNLVKTNDGVFLSLTPVSKPVAIKQDNKIREVNPRTTELLQPSDIFYFSKQKFPYQFQLIDDKLNGEEDQNNGDAIQEKSEEDNTIADTSINEDHEVEPLNVTVEDDAQAIEQPNVEVEEKEENQVEQQGKGDLEMELEEEKKEEAEVVVDHSESKEKDENLIQNDTPLAEPNLTVVETTLEKKSKIKGSKKLTEQKIDIQEPTVQLLVNRMNNLEEEVKNIFSGFSEKLNQLIALCSSNNNNNNAVNKNVVSTPEPKVVEKKSRAKESPKKKEPEPTSSPKSKEEPEKKASTPKRTQQKSTPVTKRKRAEESDDSETKKRKTEDSWSDDHGRVFKWEGDSYQDKGRIFYSSIKIGNELYSIGDTVYLASPSEVDPYIGKILALWEDRGKQMVQISWFFYYKDVEEIIGQKQAKILGVEQNPKKLYGSIQTDNNPVVTIEKRCNVKHLSELGEKAPNARKWASAKSDRFYYEKYFDSRTKKISFSPDMASLQMEFEYPNKQLN